MRIVIASLYIDRRGWDTAVAGDEQNGLLTVPLQAKTNGTLDAYQLRGRHFGLDAGLHFGALRQQQFVVFDASGRIVKGGRKPRDVAITIR